MTDIDVFTSKAGGFNTFRIPALAVAGDGTLLAFAEGRKGGGDPGTPGHELHLVLKRSMDRGDTWSDMTTVEKPEKEWSAGNPCPIYDRDTGRIWLHYILCRPGCKSNTSRPGTDDLVNLVRFSDDAGTTWSDPEDITASCRDMSSTTWRSTIMGPGGAIQDRNGRLVVPCWKWDDPLGVFAVFSDDHGTTNLAELKIDDPALLRVFAWRLRQAGRYELAAVQLRRVIKLRGEDPQSYRDLALTLDEWGRAERDPLKMEEAMELYVKVAFTPWNRHADTMGLFALEELNALINWIESAEYEEGRKPKIPVFDSKFREKLSTDLRVIMAWDADNTDIDLHVVEPGGDEAFYGHNRTLRGGIVSQDITDGYGPEEYIVSKAPSGEYEVFVNYYASRQQTLLGPATVTATVFTDWGRPEEKRQTLSVRLDTPKDKVALGKVMFGRDGGGGTVMPLLSLKDIFVGMTIADAEAILGEPKKNFPWRARIRCWWQCNKSDLWRGWETGPSRASFPRGCRYDIGAVIASMRASSCMGSRVMAYARGRVWGQAGCDKRRTGLPCLRPDCGATPVSVPVRAPRHPPPP